MTASLADRLRAVEVPDEDAARVRAQAVTRAAFAERVPARTGPRFRPAVAWAAASVSALAFLTLTSPGQAVIDSVRDSLGRVEVRQTPRPALARLPAEGSLLVQSPEGPWVVRGDGSKRLLGPYLDATWSPMGRFVGVTRANALLAVEPGGLVHWSLSRPHVSRPRWSATGFRVAYLSGRNVRVVAGDGTGDRLIGPGVAAEWQGLPPGLPPLAAQKMLSVPNILAVAEANGRVRGIDVDGHRTLWRSRVTPGRPRALSWAADGRHVLLATARALFVLDGTGAVASRKPVPAGATLTSAAYAPHGSRIALVRSRPGVSELVMVEGGRERLLFAGAGRLGGVTWSPDGNWLLVAWPTADQFLFVRTVGPARVETAQGVAAEFDPRAGAAQAGEPRPVGWK